MHEQATHTTSVHDKLPLTWDTLRYLLRSHGVHDKKIPYSNVTTYAACFYSAMFSNCYSVKIF